MLLAHREGAMALPPALPVAIAPYSPSYSYIVTEGLAESDLGDAVKGVPSEEVLNSSDHEQSGARARARARAEHRRSRQGGCMQLGQGICSCADAPAIAYSTAHPVHPSSTVHTLVHAPGHRHL